MVRASAVLLLSVPGPAVPRVAARAQSPARAAPPSSVVGTWRGTSTCRAVGKPACHDEIAVYHVRIDSATAPAAPPRDAGVQGAPTERLVLQGTKVVNGVEEEMGTLSCTYDAASGIVRCPRRGWTWTFRAASGPEGDTLTGTLESPAHAVWRDVRVARIANEP